MIRKATAADIPYILALYKEGLDELGIDDYIESQMVKKIVNSFHMAPCFLLLENANIVGMIGLTIVTISYNGVASLADYMFYIKPEHRNFKSLNELVKKAQAFADEHNMPLRVDFIINGRKEAKERLLQMNDFELYSLAGLYNGR